MRTSGTTNSGSVAVGRAACLPRRCILPWSLFSATSVALVAALACGTMAGEDGSSKQAGRLAFDIPAQSLVTALQAYSQVAGVQLLYESDLAQGRRSASVSGVLTPEAALKTLIGDADLIVHYTRADAITIVRASVGNPDVPPVHPLGAPDLTLDMLRVHGAADLGNADRLREYTGIIQADIQSALKKNNKTRSGNYSVGVKLWIAEPRTVQRAEVFRSTGDRERDADIANVLQGLAISRAAPADTPQPISIMIRVRSL